MQSIYLTLITTPGALLLQNTPEGRRLPQFTFDLPHFWQDVAPLNNAVTTCFGMGTTTLECLTIVDDEAGAEARFYYVLATVGAAVRDNAAEWIALADLAGVNWANSEHAQVVAQWQRRDQGVTCPFGQKRP